MERQTSAILQCNSNTYQMLKLLKNTLERQNIRIQTEEKTIFGETNF